MKKIGWFFHLVRKALTERRSRTLITVFALALAAALATSLIGLSLGIREKLGKELRVYGANLLIVPREAEVGSGGFNFGTVAEQSYLSEKEMLRLFAQFKGTVADYIFRLEGSGEIESKSISVVGVHFPQLRKVSGGWKIEGRWPRNSSEALVGLTLAESLRLEPGKAVGRVSIPAKNRLAKRPFKVVGVVETGGPEDNAVLLELRETQTLFGLPGKVNVVMVSARAQEESLDFIARRMRKAVSGIEVKTVEQVARAEEDLLNKVQGLMLLVTLSVVAATGISVMGTMGATVLERRQEIGLLKALGSPNSLVGALFLAEVIVISLGSSILGYLGGIFLAQIVTRNVFGTWVAVPAVLWLVALGISIGIGVLASLGPLRFALSIEPASTLRGL